VCLQEVPKYYESFQKALADKFVEEIALKHKYSVFKEADAGISILSKIPVDYWDEIPL
jgi:hypothetical protein